MRNIEELLTKCFNVAKIEVEFSDDGLDHLGLQEDNVNDGGEDDAMRRL